MLLGVIVPHGEHCKYLGVNIRNDLHWGDHINEVVKKGYKSLHMVMRVFRGCSKDVKERAYKTLVRPQLECSSSVWDPHQDYLIQELEKIQRKAARFVLGDF